MDKQVKIAMITMFKNEASVMERMLESCYKYIDYYVMQDNGSTDGTADIVNEFFKDKGMNMIFKSMSKSYYSLEVNLACL